MGLDFFLHNDQQQVVTITKCSISAIQLKYN